MSNILDSGLRNMTLFRNHRSTAAAHRDTHHLYRPDLFALDKTRLLVLGLALLGPLWCYVDLILLFLITLLLGLVYTCGLVFGRRVDCIQDQGSWASIDKLMLGPGRYDDEVAGLDILIFAGDGRLAFAGRKGQCLVDCMFLEYRSESFTTADHDAYLITNVASYWHSHEDKL